MVEAARYSVLVLAVLVLVGGIIGFKKANSKASLIAGIASSIMLGICFGLTLAFPLIGLIAAFVVSLCLDVVFGIRLHKTKKFMPAGMMLICISIMQLIVASAMFSGSFATPVAPN